ncbi:MAG: hypothetical protein R3C32_01150 [Chloroflexota bacterium]
MALYLLPTTFLPLVALTWTALTPYIMPMTLANLQEFASLDAFRAVLADKEFWASLMRTVVIATAAATISVLLATIVAFVVARSRASRKTQAMDILASSSSPSRGHRGLLGADAVHGHQPHPASPGTI